MFRTPGDNKSQDIRRVSMPPSSVSSAVEMAETRTLVKEVMADVGGTFSLDENVLNGLQGLISTREKIFAD